MPRGIASQPAWRPGTVRGRTLMHEPLGEDAGGECESATGAQEQMRAAEDLREIPPEDHPQDVLGCHSCYERGRAKTSTSVMITRRFQYRSVSAHRSLACGSRVSQAGWVSPRSILAYLRSTVRARGGVHPEYPARRDLLVLPTATFRAEPRQVATKGDPARLHLSDTVRARGRATARPRARGGPSVDTCD